MKYKLERINEDVQALCTEISSDLRAAEGHLGQIGDEYHRVTELSGQAARIVDQIDMDFKVKTKLSSVDITILFLATAIQCARQYLLTNDKLRLTAQQGDKLIEKGYETTIGKIAPPTWEEVLLQSVPYDAIQTGPHVSETGLSGTTHRFRTLGHDPLFGWIFGTANIMTSSLTKTDFITTYQVSNNIIIRRFPMGTMGMLDRAAGYAQQDPLLLAASVARQAIHFGSDYFTKQGLPIPLLATVDNHAAQKMLQNWHIDMWSIMRGAALSALINQMVCLIHQLFYDEKKHGSPGLYEVRTRKILSYSNMLATGSNVIVTALTRDVTKLDVGGMVVTLTRIISDYNFIHEIKKDFLKNELYDRVVGSEYDFMKGDA